MNEWQFTSDVAKWITLILEKNLRLPFGDAYCEGQAFDSPKRRDLTIEDRNGRVVLTGEVKLPGKKDGATPYNAKVVADARYKAHIAKAKFFFTWNVNECVLWKTEVGSELPRPDYKSWRVTDVHNAGALEFPDVQSQIKKWLAVFLRDVADILRGESILDKKSPDEKFIDALEAALATPIALTTGALFEKHRRKSTREEIDKWMREDLGFTLINEPSAIRANLENASKHACYAIANKLVFYEALLKRYGALLPTLDIPEHITGADPLRLHINAFFSHAKRVTHDYETVFDENALGLESRVPFYNDGVVDFWKAFVEEIQDFDFSQLDYEIIGRIFERLISPEERSKYGQFYTRVEVVDLINSFSIRTGEENVLDPACGGGTFLVRAYARKRELAPHVSHSKRLKDLYGIDISRFATHLSTINLATRDLIDEANYPQIARSDFFNIKPFNTIVTLPRTVSVSGLGKTQRRDVQIPSLDVIVGNPPYIRQEEIPKSPKGQPIQRGTKDFYQHIAQSNGANLTLRSDIHCYFWPHSYSFLKSNGYLCFVTSSQWLDTEYGFRLQDWILRNFEIVAILESIVEPWFVGARVVTATTILRGQIDGKMRLENVVRFIQLRKPMSQIFDHDGTTAGAVIAADRFRDELLAIENDVSNDRYRARIIQQSELWHDGVSLGVAMGKFNAPSDDGNLTQSGNYYGGKWGIELRAPDLWFEMLSQFGDSLVPLSKIAKIRRGITSGKDVFFFPKDISKQALEETDPKNFSAIFRANRDDVASSKVKIVKAGEGYEEMHPIESKFLEPEVHSLMNLESFMIQEEDCSRLVFLAPSERSNLSNTYAMKYIEWGERNEYHLAPTTRGRTSKDREWYDLTNSPRMGVIIPKIQQYRLFTLLNEDRYLLASALLGVVDAQNISSGLLAGLLNSTFSILSRILYSRVLGNEGNIQLDVYSAQMMLVPDPRIASAAQKKRVIDAFQKLRERPVLAFLSERRLREMSYLARSMEDKLGGLSDESELTQKDRRELDDAVLELLGVASKLKRKQILDGLYEYLEEFFELTRQKEEKAIENKKRAKRRKSVRSSELVTDITETIKQEFGWLLRVYDDFVDLSQPYDTYEIPVEGKPAAYDGLFERSAIRFIYKDKQESIMTTRNDSQRDLLLILAENNVRGLVRVPLDEHEAKVIKEKFGGFIRRRDKTIRGLVEERTADPDMQEKVYGSLIKQVSFDVNI